MQGDRPANRFLVRREHEGDLLHRQEELDRLEALDDRRGKAAVQVIDEDYDPVDLGQLGKKAGEVGPEASERERLLLGRREAVDESTDVGGHGDRAPQQDLAGARPAHPPQEAADVLEGLSKGSLVLAELRTQPCEDRVDERALDVGAVLELPGVDPDDDVAVAVAEVPVQELEDGGLSPAPGGVKADRYRIESSGFEDLDHGSDDGIKAQEVDGCRVVVEELRPSGWVTRHGE